MRKLLTSLFVILAVLFLATAVYYWVTKAGSLPHFFPGYQAGSIHKHLKHGLAALIVAIGFAIYLRWALRLPMLRAIRMAGRPR